MNKKYFIIAGGGTGGHIYPGVAVAKSIKNKLPNSEVIFVGTSEGLEKKIVPQEGFSLELISVGKLNRAGGFLTQLKTLGLIPFAFLQSFKILKKYKPHSVLGVGGYASGPFLLVAYFLGYKASIWEANAQPGLTNRWLSRFVKKAFLVFSEAGNFLKSESCVTVGLPVREEIANPLPQTSSDQFRILVFGGSQGARAINNVVSDLIINEKLPNIKFIHQSGKLDFTSLKKKYQGHEDQVQLHEFLYDMNVQYANCDLVICRGGAGTVTELSASGKVAIIVPLPTAADNHQQKNAETLVNHGAGIMILQKELTVEKLKNEILKLKENHQMRKQISENIKKLFIPNAADKMAEDLIGGLV